ncbi:DUF2726 domain-containing protein [Priestia megaterium]|uniref:DUF2726 domain-containing protein n=1 Tax=Priestia megaterium TaxID=1404 RepID=UPI000BFB7955|nr:DUF2726 domain-containing protein [Priestia megaterium]PGY54152.1 hypothetical protein COE35_03935 [Priestia megaterium]
MELEVRKFEELHWQLVMDEPKEPESIEELYSLLFPKNTEVEVEFKNPKNLIPLLTFVKWKLSNYNLKDVYNTYIIERVLLLCSELSEYRIGMEFADTYKVNQFLSSIKENENKHEIYGGFKSLIINYLVVKYKSIGLEEEDFYHFTNLILEIEQKTWFEPVESHEILIEIYIETISHDLIPHNVHERMLLRLPVFYLKNTHLQFLSLQQEFLDNMDKIFSEYYNSTNFQDVSTFFRSLVEFVHKDLFSNSKNENDLIKYPLLIIKNINKKKTETYESLYGELIDSLLEFFVDYFLKGEVTEGALDDYLKILKDCEKTVYKVELLKKHHFQKTSIIPILRVLYENAKYSEFYKVYQNWLLEEQQILVKKQMPFECAYTFKKMGDVKASKIIYEDMLINGNEYPGVYNNLAVIYMDEKDYEKALELLEKGKSIEPDDEHINKNIKNVKIQIEEAKQKPKKMKDMYFKKTDKLHKKIIFSIYKLEEDLPITDEKLIEVTKISNEHYFYKLLHKLLDLEIVFADKNKGYILDETIYKLVENYIDPQLEREVVKVNQNKLFRPIFYHESEINLYRVLNELFPQHFVFPNMDLKTIIDVDKIRDYLEPDVLEYMFKAHVDFAIIDTTTYFPIITFEKDSEYQDIEPHKSNVIKKNTIFQTSGLPLIRLRYSSAMDYERLKEEIKQATKEFILEIKSENQEHELLKHFDLKRLGIYGQLPSIEEIKDTWGNIVGELIAKKTQDMSVDEEQAILTINVSSEIESIIKLSQENIKSQMYQRVNELNQIRILYQD